MPTVFESGNQELVDLRNAPSLPHLEAYFRARVREWPYPMKHCECFTIGTFDDLGSAFPNGDAFDLVQIAALLPWDDLPEAWVLLAIDLLLTLASESNTTELPQALVERWDGIASRLSTIDQKYSAWTELARHYGKKS